MKLLTIINHARKELRNIKREATPEELGELLVHINDLDGINTTKCVYGLMTGDCYSERAIHLIKKCTANGYLIDISYGAIKNTGIESIDVTDILTYNTSRNYSCLEAYLSYNEIKDRNSLSKAFVLKYLS